MIIPSIDIHNGQAVQMVRGETKGLELGDPMAVAERLAVAGARVASRCRVSRGFCK